MLKSIFDVYRAKEGAIIGAVSVGSFFVVWELASRVGLLSPLFYSSPTAVIAAGVREVQIGRFWNDFLVSFTEFGVGYGLGLVLAVPLGLMIGWYRPVRYFFDPIINFLYALPRVSLLPLLILWLGIGIWSKLAIVFLGAFVIILINVLHGVRTVDERFLTVGEMFGASDLRRFRTIVFPSTIPFIIAGARLGIGRALIGVVIGEFYAAQEGLGLMLIIASNNLQMDRVLFVVLVLVFWGVALVEVIRIFERRFSVWRQDVGTGF